jgi:hypothetical protein
MISIDSQEYQIEEIRVSQVESCVIIIKKFVLYSHFNIFKRVCKYLHTVILTEKYAPKSADVSLKFFLFI